ncbi:MAG: type IV secretion protein IcmO [Micavibrio sp.]|nr:type IV secretion protein IcmO [Micavibrio sp.]
MALDQRKYETKWTDILRDNRSFWMRAEDVMSKPSFGFTIMFCAAASIHFIPQLLGYADLIFLFSLLFFWWLRKRDRTIIFKMPYGAKYADGNNDGPGRNKKPEGILYLGNHKETKEEIWFSDSDARTHILYLGTTGSGKTEGLKSMVSNAMTWASGFVYIDGKADTDLWSSLSSLVRRFGRDDDLFVLNYMTGNSDIKAPSNSMNPFSAGSASYLTQMLTSLMPESEGDNAMWKERAVSLIGTVLPALTWKRDNQDVPLNVTTIRKYLQLNSIVKLSREEALPDHLRDGVKGYLDTLPGFSENAWDDEGREKPAGPGQPPIDQTTAHQQHGYLSMQFTRSLQSLGDEYGYIFDAAYADVNMVDIVLNRRILVVLIPALEKSGDEIANLGKIVAATLKGMMGSTLGSTVEGSSETVIENKPTKSATPFMTVFDEVGYYTAEGMAVMAAQARSLGFSLIFSAQDLPALEKRVKEEARSITANCNIKIFGKLEDPTQTKEFFEKTVGQAMVTELSSLQTDNTGFTKTYYDTHQAGVQLRGRASYDGLRGFKEGQAVVTFGEGVVDANIFYSNPGFAKAMRVTRLMSLEPHDEQTLKHASAIAKLRDKLVKKNWSASRADVSSDIPEMLGNLAKAIKAHNTDSRDPVDQGIFSVVDTYLADNQVDWSKVGTTSASPATQPAAPASPQAEAKPATFAGQETTSQPLDESVQPIAPHEKAMAQPQQSSQQATAQTQQDQPKAAPQKSPRHHASSAALDILRKAAKSARSQLVRSDKSEQSEDESEPAE